MADPVRLYFDQHMRNAVVGQLRRKGVDVLSAHEAGRCGFSDIDQIRYATTVVRSVVTFDIDYLTLAADFQTRGEDFAGVVYCDPARYLTDPGRLIHSLLILHGVLTAADMLDTVEYL